MLADSAVPFHAVREWVDRFPWLIAGITHAGPLDQPFDLRLFGEDAPSAAGDRWETLLEATGFGAVAHARQVHETRVAIHAELRRGVHMENGTADGHATSTAGVLLAVTVADCVPVYLVDPKRRALALLHAGWRGIAAGILTEGVRALHTRFASEATRLWVHLGPAICGTCYEVGPEVFAALELTATSGPAPVDVRAVLVSQALALGIPEGHVTVSEQCTLCGTAGLFSHRGGRSERQAALLGLRP
jgi:YfiH family protein